MVIVASKYVICYYSGVATLEDGMDGRYYGYWCGQILKIVQKPTTAFLPFPVPRHSGHWIGCSAGIFQRKTFPTTEAGATLYYITIFRFWIPHVLLAASSVGAGA